MNVKDYSLLSNESSDALVVKLSAEIGTEMQAELSNVEGRIKLTLLGILSGQYLIYQIPKSLLKATTSSVFATASVIKIRCISRGIAFGFTAPIISFLKHPDLLLFVKYPENIQKQAIRKNQRVKCLLPATITQATASISGTIADLSSSGCHFQAKKTSLTTEQIKMTQENELISVELALPGIDRKMKVNATIKNIFVDSDKAQIGIQFNDVENSILTNIEAFVDMSFELAPF